MSAKHAVQGLCALAALAAWPAAAQSIRIDFVTVVPVPIAGWIVAAIAGTLAYAAHRTLRGRARKLGTMAAAAVAAGSLAWQALTPSVTHAVPPTTVVNLTASPASVSLQDADFVYQLVNATSGTIRILSIERVDASDFTFLPAPEPQCDKEQVLAPGQFCHVALGPIT